MTNIGKHRFNNFRPGMTMIELLVAVSVLAILILIFGRVLSQSQRVVTNSQELIKFNAGSTAAANTLKKDIQKITTTNVTGTGYFLYIINETVPVDTNGDGSNDATWPHAKMYMGITGSFTSWYNSAITDTGAIIGIGLCNQNGITDQAKPKLLWRTRCIMSTNTLAPTTPVATNDTWRQSFTATENNGGLTKRNYLLTQWLNAIVGNAAWSPSADTAGMTFPPATITDIDKVWKYIIPNVNRLSIMWTKGDVTATNKSLIWYGVDIDGVLHVPGDFPNYPANYSNSNANRRFNDKMDYSAQTVESIYGTPSIDNYPKFEFRNDGFYCALWNSELTSDYWPTAIKITYEVTDGKAENPTTKIYEIICNTAIPN